MKVHVHTNHPGQAIQNAHLPMVQLSRMKIDNMREEHQEKLIKDAEKLASKEQAEEESSEPAKEIRSDLSAVSVGEGLSQICSESLA